MLKKIEAIVETLDLNNENAVAEAGQELNKIGITQTKVWSEKLNATLLHYFTKNLSLDQTAAALNSTGAKPGATRNTVVGRLNTIGLVGAHFTEYRNAKANNALKPVKTGAALNTAAESKETPAPTSESLTTTLKAAASSAPKTQKTQPKTAPTPLTPQVNVVAQGKETPAPSPKPPTTPPKTAVSSAPETQKTQTKTVPLAPQKFKMQELPPKSPKKTAGETPQAHKESKTKKPRIKKKSWKTIANEWDLLKTEEEAITEQAERTPEERSKQQNAYRAYMNDYRP